MVKDNMNLTESSLVMPWSNSVEDWLLPLVRKYLFTKEVLMTCLIKLLLNVFNKIIKS